jgi:hypothetical protein
MQMCRKEFMQIKRKMFVALLAGILLVSCSGQATGEPTLDVNALMTEGVGTFVAALTQTQAAKPATPTATFTASPMPTTSPVSLGSLTPLVTSTQSFVLPASTIIFVAPTGTQYTPTADPSSLAVGCNNLRLISQAMDPSGPVLLPGQTFIKSWQVENNGTCTWAFLYGLVFISGDRMDGEPSRSGNQIEPGRWTRLTVTGKAPTRPGTYAGYWRFANQAGTPFGATLSVTFTVANPTNTAVPPTPTNTTAPSYP